LIWKSDLIAEINGLTDHSNTELHERIEHSPPLVLDNVVYVGLLRGGAIWNGPATDGDDIYFTTGNTNQDYGYPPLRAEPEHNHGVSMVKIDLLLGLR